MFLSLNALFCLGDFSKIHSVSQKNISLLGGHRGILQGRFRSWSQPQLSSNAMLNETHLCGTPPMFILHTTKPRYGCINLKRSRILMEFARVRQHCSRILRRKGWKFCAFFGNIKMSRSFIISKWYPSDQLKFSPNSVQSKHEIKIGR